jgi:long-chain acyl-CoA synthetase
MSLNLATLLRESAIRYPDRPALIGAATTLPYSALHGAAQRFAGALGSLGLRRGQHVALLLPNVPQFTIAYFGAHYAGCPIVPLNVLLTADEIAYHLTDSDAVAVVVWEGFLPQARAALARIDSCRHLIVARADASDASAAEGALSLTALLAGSEPLKEAAPTMADDTAVILYTSGTTGRPKGAELTHLNLFLNAHYFRTELLPVTVDTVALAVLPLFHSFGQTCIQNAVLAAGGAVVLMPRFDADGAMQLIETHGVSYFAECYHVFRAAALPGGEPVRSRRAAILRLGRIADAGGSDEGLRRKVRSEHPRGLRAVGDLAGRELQHTRSAEESGLGRRADRRLRVSARGR